MERTDFEQINEADIQALVGSVSESQRVELPFIVRTLDARVSHEVHMPDDKPQDTG